MRTKVNIDSVLLPVMLESIEEELKEAKKELDNTSSGDLRENEPWAAAKSKYEEISHKRDSIMLELQDTLELGRDLLNDSIEFGDLLKISVKGSDTIRILRFGPEGDPIISETLDKESLLGKEIHHQCPGEFIIIKHDGEALTYVVDFVYQDEQEIVETFSKQHLKSTEEILNGLLEEVGD